MVITGYEPQKRCKDKMNIFVDDEYKFSLSMDKFLECQIHKGMKVSDDMIEEMKSEDEKNLAFLKLLYIVSYGMKTEKEFRDKLKSKGFSEESIENAIKKGKKYGYVDDEHYIESYIRTRAIPSRWGDQKIISRLYPKGFEISYIKDKIEELYDENDKYQNALELAEKKATSIKDAEKYKKKQKLFSFLVSKGFSYEIINEVLKQVLCDEG